MTVCLGRFLAEAGMSTFNRDLARGKKDDRAWVESGRSIASLKVAYNYLARGACTEDEDDDLEKKMLREFRDDNEFQAAQNENVVYITGFYEAVCEDTRK